MAYNQPIHFDIPDEESKPIVKYVENSYRYLDFYECSEPSYKYPNGHNALGRRPPLDIQSKQQIDTLIRGSTISEDGTFTKEMRYSSIEALRLMGQESGSVSVGYDTNNPKSTEFAKTNWTVDLSTSFHNDLQISGFLGVSTATKFTTISDDQDITIAGIDLRKEFFNYRLGILKAYNPLIRDLVRVGGNVEYKDYDQEYILGEAQKFVKSVKNQTPIYKSLTKNDIPLQTYGLQEFGRQNETLYDSSMKIDFKDLDNKLVRCTIVLNDGSTVDGLVKDFYVAVHPVESKMMSLQTFIEKYGIFADLTKPLVKIEPSIRSYNIAYKDDEPNIDYHTSDTEHNLTYAQSANKRGAFLGLSDSLTDKKKLFVTVPNSSPGLYDRRYTPYYSYSYEVSDGVSRNEQTNRLARFTTMDGTRRNGFFDFLRHAIYSSRNYYDNGLNYFRPVYADRSVNSPASLQSILRQRYSNELQRFGFVNPSNHNKSFSSLFDSNNVPYGGSWSGDAWINVFNHTPSTQDGIFVHLYDLEVSFYPKTINTANPSLKITDIKEIQYQTTDKTTITAQIEENSLGGVASFEWSLSSYKNSNTKNFYMYDVENGKTFSTIQARHNSLISLDSTRSIFWHRDLAFERNANRSFDVIPKNLEFKVKESGKTFKETNQLLETAANLNNQTIPDIVFPTINSPVQAAAISPPNPEPINISHDIDLQNQHILVTWDNGLSGTSEEYSALSFDSDNSQLTTHVLRINKIKLTIYKLDPATNYFVEQHSLNYGANRNQHTIGLSPDITNFLKEGQKGNIDYQIIITAEYSDTLRGTITADPVKTVVDVDPTIISLLPQLKPVKPQLSVRRTGVDFISLGFVNDVPQGPYESLMEHIKHIEVEYYASNDVFDKSNLIIPWSRRSSSGEFRLDNLINSTNYTISIKIKNDYGISESSDTVIGTTTEPTGISNIKISKESVAASRFVITVKQTNKSNRTRNLTGINFTYLRSGENIIFPVNTGSVKMASFEPVQRLIDGSLEEDVVFYSSEGVYTIYAEPVFENVNGRKDNVSNINVKRTNVSLPPVAVPVDGSNKDSDIGVSNRYIYRHSDVPFYDTDSSLSSNASLRLLDSTYTKENQTVVLSNVNDISPEFRPSHIAFLLNKRMLKYTIDHFSRQTFYNRNYNDILNGRSHYNLNNLKPSFRFAIQKSYVRGQSGQGCHLVGLFGPNPFMLYDLSTPAATYKNPINIEKSSDYIKLPDGKIRSSANRLEDSVLFYYKLETPADSFTNFYYYDESNDTLYLQVAQGLNTRYVSIKDVLKGFKYSGFPAAHNNPYVISFPAKLYRYGSYGYTVPFGSVSNQNPNNTFSYRNIITQILPDNFIIKDDAEVPSSLQLSQDPKSNISGFQETNPDNGFYLETNNFNRNFYRASTTDTSSNALSPQQWESVNFPTSVNVLYEDSGFYLTKRSSTARTPTGIAVPAPVILSASKNDGVGTYQGFSTINIEAKFTGSLNLDIYQFRGYVVEKYVDSSWVQIETSSVYTEYDPQDRFQSNFSFKIFLADGVARYRMAVKLRGVADDVEIIGSYVELEKLTENLITEDFD